MARVKEEIDKAAALAEKQRFYEEAERSRIEKE